MVKNLSFRYKLCHNFKTAKMIENIERHTFVQLSPFTTKFTQDADVNYANQ